MSVVIQIKKYGNVSRAAKIHAKGYSHSKFMPAELYLSVLSNRNSCLTKEYTCIQYIRYIRLGEDMGFIMFSWQEQ